MPDGPPPPPVTVHDPGRGDRPSEVLDGARPPAPWLRPLSAVVALVVLAVLAVRLGEGVQERQAAEAERQRLEATVDVAVIGRPRQAFRNEPTLGTAGRTLPLTVINRGPRPVSVLSAGYGPLRFTGEVEIEPSRTGVVLLDQTLDCRSDRERLDVTGSFGELAMTVQTPAGERDARIDSSRLPDDELRTGARTACGFPPVEQALQVSGDVVLPGVTVDPRAVSVRVTVEVSTLDPVRLLEIDFGQGLAVRLREREGGTLRLPLRMPTPRPGTTIRRTFDADVTVANCATAGTSGDGTVLAEIDGVRAPAYRAPIGGAGALSAFVLASCVNQR